MKSREEIQTMVLDEIRDNFSTILSAKTQERYYNQFFGDLSYLIAGLLDILLSEKVNEWEAESWIDDSLITGFKASNKNLNVWGVMIWGSDNSTEQWVDPFYFDIELLADKSRFKRYSFLFADVNIPSLPYTLFSKQPDFWDSYERDWKYILTIAA